MLDTPRPPEPPRDVVARLMARHALEAAADRTVIGWRETWRAVRSELGLPPVTSADRQPRGLARAVCRVGRQVDPSMPLLFAAFHGRSVGKPAAGYAGLVKRERNAGREVGAIWHVEVQRLHDWAAANPEAVQALRESLLEDVAPVPAA